MTGQDGPLIQILERLYADRRRHWMHDQEERSAQYHHDMLRGSLGYCHRDILNKSGLMLEAG